MRGRGKNNTRNLLSTPRVARGELPQALLRVERPPHIVRSLHDWNKYAHEVYEKGKMTEDEYCVPVKEWFEANWKDNPDIEETYEILSDVLHSEGIESKFLTMSNIDDGIPGYAVNIELELDGSVEGEVAVGLFMGPDKILHASLLELSCKTDDGHRVKDHPDLDKVLQAVKKTLKAQGVKWLSVHAYSSKDAQYYLRQGFCPVDYFPNPEAWRARIDSHCTSSAELWTDKDANYSMAPLVSLKQLKGFQKLLNTRGQTPQELLDYELTAGDQTGVKIFADLPMTCRFDALCKIDR